MDEVRQSVLQLAGLTVKYGDKVAVDDIELSLPEGQILAVLGPSGCGKSTVLRAVAGLEPPTSGRIEFRGRDLAGVPTHKRGFALMFQDGQLFDHYSVARNVGYALRLRRVPRREIDTRVTALLETVGLTGYADRMPATLSGGERQRVALARALAVDPKLMLLDEPLSALDAGLRQRLAADLRRILAGTATVLVTHDHDEAFAVADRIAVMRDGRIVQEGPIALVWQHPVDSWTARFLGYATILEGAAVDPLRGALAEAGAGDAESLVGSCGMALRRSALVLADDGVLSAAVTGLQATPDQLRLRVRLAVGAAEEDLHAVAPLGSRLAVGDAVRLRIDASRVAPVG